jgi:hypothetical protein
MLVDALNMFSCTRWVSLRFDLFHCFKYRAVTLCVGLLLSSVSHSWELRSKTLALLPFRSVKWSWRWVRSKVLGKHDALCNWWCSRGGGRCVDASCRQHARRLLEWMMARGAIKALCLLNCSYGIQAKCYIWRCINSTTVFLWYHNYLAFSLCLLAYVHYVGPFCA